MAGGWFPRFNRDGSKVTSESPGHWQAQWIGDNTEIYHNGKHLVIGGVETSFDSLNELTAGGGKWAGDKGSPNIYTSWGITITGAGNAALSPSGRFAYKVDRQSNDSPLMLEGVGVVSKGPISDVRISDSLLVWTEGSRHSFGYINTKTDLGLNGVATYRPIPIDTPEGPWVLNNTDTGIILRPISDPKHGFRFDNGGQTYYPDGVYINNNIKVAFTNSAGQYTEMLFALDRPKVNLESPIIVQPPDPPKEPMSDPLDETDLDRTILGELNAQRGNYPNPLPMNQLERNKVLGEYLNSVVWSLNQKGFTNVYLEPKAGELDGNVAIQPFTNVTIANDIIQTVENGVKCGRDFLGSTGPGEPANPQLGDKGYATLPSIKAVDPKHNVPPIDDGDSNPTPPPIDDGNANPPGLDLSELITFIQGTIASLQAELDAIQTQLNKGFTAATKLPIFGNVTFDIMPKK
jgi:hypothetical protein